MPLPRSHPRPVRLALVLALTVLVGTLASCGGDDESTSTRAPTSTATSPTTTSPDAPSTTEAAPAYRSWIANVRPEVGSVIVHDSPGGTQLQLDTAGDGTLRPVAVANPLTSGAPATFLLKQPGETDAAGTGWLEVYLPVRPNGSTGWISAADATVTTTDLAATVHLSTHQVELTDAGAVVATYPVAVGAAGTPTPTGRYFVKELIETPDPAGSYGPIAYGLSAFSPTLVDTEAFADGVIGLHGTNKPDLIGTDVSHGCVRLRNADILDLEQHQVPLGMPVTITA